MFRTQPKMPAGEYVSFGVRQPRATHFRPATCAEVECAAWAYGWRTLVDTTDQLGRDRADYIRARCGRVFSEHRPDKNGVIVFEFTPGQRCFGRHEVPLGRPALFVVRGGDWRGNPRQTPTIRHRSAEDWRDHFAEHQAALADRINQG